MRRRTIGIAVTVVIVVLATLCAMRRDRGGMTVDTQPAARKVTFRSFVTASGQVVAQRYADIGSSVMGRLVELRVKEGEMVVMGTQNQPGTTLMTNSDLSSIDTEVKFKVKVRLDNPDRVLRPGLSCDAEILTAERQGVLAVPLQAVVIRPGKDGQDQTGVFIPDGPTVRFQPVKTGLIGGFDIEVTGLNEGTPVVTGPFQALRELKDGQAVRTQAPK
jgi:multidrug efflux pump subunit AcrA (membrane-fusion protein)